MAPARAPPRLLALPRHPGDLVAGGGSPADPVSDGGGVHWLAHHARDRVAGGAAPPRRRRHGHRASRRTGCRCARASTSTAAGRTPCATASSWPSTSPPSGCGASTATPARSAARPTDAAVRWGAPLVDLDRGVVLRGPRGPPRPRRRAGQRAGAAAAGARRASPGSARSSWPAVAGRCRVPTPTTRATPRCPTSSPTRCSPPTARRLAWVQWSHPAMPWDAAVGAGRRARRRRGATGWPGSSRAARAARPVEPVWVDADRLAFLADPEGFAVPHVVDVTDRRLRPACAGAEPAASGACPGWSCGRARCALLPDGRLVGVRHVEGVGAAERGRPRRRRPTPRPRPAAGRGLRARHRTPAAWSPTPGCPTSAGRRSTVAVDGDERLARGGRPCAAPCPTRRTSPGPEPISWTGYGRRHGLRLPAPARPTPRSAAPRTSCRRWWWSRTAARPRPPRRCRARRTPSSPPRHRGARRRLRRVDRLRPRLPRAAARAVGRRRRRGRRRRCAAPRRHRGRRRRAARRAGRLRGRVRRPRRAGLPRHLLRRASACSASPTPRCWRRRRTSSSRATSTA